ncbi:MFS transporter [Domibacillus tundrae]|uniref:MFS transporter n=1 Tax=Domibacillus tundrae TaxID=1587527 RepID=UPI000617C606|nr:MFS transporter [Domibacillus tundrae]
MKWNYFFMLATVFVGFLIFGFSENVKGPAMPRIQADFELDAFQVGTLLSFNSIAYLLACTFTAYLTRRFGIKVVSVASFGFMTLSGIFIYFSNTYTGLAGAYFFMYVGNGMLEIVLAILSARLFVKNTGTMMNLAHFFYGLSSIVAPILASGLMNVTMSGVLLDWRGMYLIVMLLSLIPMIPAFASRFPADDFQAENRLPMQTLMRDPVIWLIVLILSFGVVSEMSVGGWLVNFLEKAYGWSNADASKMLSIFFLFFTFSRLFLGPITDRIGFTVSLILFGGLSALLTFIGLVIGEPGAILLAAAGIGIAPVYPTVMAMIARRYRENSDTAITFVVTLMGIGTVAGNFIIGAIITGINRIVAEQAGAEMGVVRGMQAGYAFIGICALFCALFSFILYVYLCKQKEVI